MQEAVHPVLLAAFGSLDRHGVRWALIRGADDLARPQGDVDLLVARGQVRGLDAVLAEAGLHRVPAAGHGSHRFYFAYDEQQDLWLKVDVVSRIAFGPYQDLGTRLARGCLERRERRGVLSRLSTADEAWLFLLHLLLDKQEVAPDRMAAAQQAAVSATMDAPAARRLRRLVRADLLQAVAETVLGGRPDRIAALSSALRRDWVGRRPLRTRSRYVATRVARRVGVPLVGPRPRGFLVAILGPDGAGKTTLAQGLDRALPLPTVSCYLGMWRSTPYDPWLRRVPGGRLGLTMCRLLSATALVRYHRLRGRVVLVDRYVYDVLLPGDRDPSLGGRISAATMLRSAPTPDVVLLLDAPGEVMFARKQEHSVEVLERRRAGYLDLADRLQGSVVLDATAPADDLRRRAVALVWRRAVTSSAELGREDSRSDARSGGERGPAVGARSDEHGPVQGWRRIDWRFLLPSLDLGTVLVTGGPEPELVSALRDAGAQVTMAPASVPGNTETESQIETDAGPGGPVDLAVVLHPTATRLREAVAAVRPGGWVVVEVRRRLSLRPAARQSLHHVSRRLRALDVLDVSAQWHAPDLATCARIVPLDSRPAVRNTLGRHQHIRFGRTKARLGKLAMRAGLLAFAVPEGTVVGRVAP